MISLASFALLFAASAGLVFGPGLTGSEQAMALMAGVRTIVERPASPTPEASAAGEPVDPVFFLVMPDLPPSPAPVMFDGRPLKPVRTVFMLVTAYCPGKCCCGPRAQGITASGMSVETNGMKLVAADTRVLPFRSLVTVPGYDDQRPVPVLDRGGKIKGMRLDVLMPTHEQALQWGVRRVPVTIWDYAD